MSLNLSVAECIPTEILILIGRECATDDMARLARTCRRFHAIIEPLLYKSSIRTDVKKAGCSFAVLWGAGNGMLNTIKAAVAQGALLTTRWCHIPRPTRLQSYPKSSNAGRPTISFSSRHWDLPQPVRSVAASRMRRKTVLTTALHAAASSGHDHVVAYLLDAGCHPGVLAQNVCRCRPYNPGYRSAEPQTKSTPLHAAVCNGHTSTARLLMSRGAEINNVFIHNNTNDKIPLLHTAAARGLVPLIQYIVLDKGYDVNTLDGGYSPNTALNYAVAMVDNEAIAELVRLGAVTEGRGTTSPLYDALISHNHDAAIRLIHAGARTDVEFFGKTPLHCISLHETQPSLRNGSFEKWPELISLLLEKGADINALTPTKVAPLRKETPIFSLCRHPVANVDVIAFLLEAGADPNICNEYEDTPIRAVIEAMGPTLPWDKAETAIKPLSLLINHGTSFEFYLKTLERLFQVEVELLSDCGLQHVSPFLEAAKALPSRNCQPWSLIDDALERLFDDGKMENCFCEPFHLVDSLMVLSHRRPKQDLMDESAKRCFEMGLVKPTQAWLRHGAKIRLSARHLGIVENELELFLEPSQLELLRKTNTDSFELGTHTAMKILISRRRHSLMFPDRSVFLNEEAGETICENILLGRLPSPM